MINPNYMNHYWIVAASTTQVWSSASMSYVPVTDSTYQAWLSIPAHGPSPIASDAELFQVLMNQCWPAVSAAGVAVTSTGTPALDGTYSILDRDISNITALATGIAAGKPLPGGGSTFNYPDITGAAHAFSAANFLNFGTAIEDYVYNYRETLLTLLGGGSGSLPSSSLTIA